MDTPPTKDLLMFAPKKDLINREGCRKVVILTNKQPDFTIQTGVLSKQCVYSIPEMGTDLTSQKWDLPQLQP